jgi:hypothetical protein
MGKVVTIASVTVVVVSLGTGPWAFAFKIQLYKNL